MNRFNILLDKYKTNKNPYLEWDKIEVIKPEVLVNYDLLSSTDSQNISELSKKICVIKLNGGLGTTMGCKGPKSLLTVKENYNFMDIILKQANLTPQVPLILMNSFYTNDATNEYLVNNKNSWNNLNITPFQQNFYPRILKETLLPLIDDIKNIDNYYPPGHGDLLQSLFDNNILDKLINLGVEYAFISNIDNLGGTLDYKILSDLLKSDVEFAVELTSKTLSDVKGGTLVKYDNKYKMFEVAQCPLDKLDQFTSIDKFKYFNTNNIWIKLSAIKSLLQTDYFRDIDMIINPKKLKDGRECIQLEYAIGSLVKFFDKVKCYLVKRNRFIPVKTNNDLEIIKSSKYELDKKKWTLNLTK